MKKILIISDGDVGSRFIQRISETYSSENIYYIVEIKAKEYEGINPSKFKFHEFDPTSLYKLSNLLKMEFIQVVVAMDNLVDVENTIKNIRVIKKQLRIVVLTKWEIENDEPKEESIDLSEYSHTHIRNKKDDFEAIDIKDLDFMK